VLTRELRLLLVFFAVLALFAGVLLFVRSAHTDSSFSWTIKPPLTAAFLGASYWAACVLFAWSARQRLWVRARPALLPAFVIATLLLVTTIVHFDRFHKDLFGYFWLTAYIVVPPLMILALARQLRADPVSEPARRPLPQALRGARPPRRGLRPRATGGCRRSAIVSGCSSWRRTCSAIPASMGSW